MHLRQQSNKALHKYGAGSLGALIGRSVLSSFGKSQQMPSFEAGGIILALVGTIGLLVTGFKFVARVYNDRNTPTATKEQDAAASPNTLHPETEPIPSPKN